MKKKTAKKSGIDGDDGSHDHLTGADGTRL